MCGKSTVDSFPDYSGSPGGVPQSYAAYRYGSSPVTPAALLTAARELIASPINWIRGSYQSHRYTDDAGVRLPRSVPCYCAVGALREAAFRLGVPEYVGAAEEALACLAKVSPLASRSDIGTEGKVTTFNDNPYTKHEDVLALFDKASEACSV